MVQFDIFYLEQLIIDETVLTESGTHWVADDLNEYNQVKETWKHLAKENATYDYVDEESPFFIGLIIPTENDGHEVVFRRGIGFSIITED